MLRSTSQINGRKIYIPTETLLPLVSLPQTIHSSGLGWRFFEISTVYLSPEYLDLK